MKYLVKEVEVVKLSLNHSSHRSHYCNYLTANKLLNYLEPHTWFTPSFQRRFDLSMSWDFTFKLFCHTELNRALGKGHKIFSRKKISRLQMNDDDDLYKYSAIVLGDDKME
ncbi:CLUMA_CG010361, isoform A [Clunio marinus]|uniref:CLUMA_CG010361, isoform A n=1 Tax=Clunio marinus TaxID=568069 RepID=A0A1J1IB95_9DIPT|nr:CLUMA_CG010361, isoform A [Clunio marinus]